MGLYFNLSIVLLYILIIALYFILKKIKNKKEKFNFLSPNRYFKYAKLILKKEVLALIIFSSIISNSIVIYQNIKYNNLYKNIDEVEGEAEVLSEKIEKKYTISYKIKINYLNKNTKYKDTCLYLNVNKKNLVDLQYGDKIKIKGEFVEPEVARNYGGFNYKEYLKFLKIYGTIKANSVIVVKKNKGNLVIKISNTVYNRK